MSDEYKGQLEASGRGKNKQKTIRLAGIKTDMMTELKKSISRVPFTSDYEIHMRFPGKLFFANGGDMKSKRNVDNLPRRFADGFVNDSHVTNPVYDISPNQHYNPKTIKYVEERIPFLTKSVSGFDQSERTVKKNILNREFTFSTGHDYGEMTITFYDMYVQDEDGISEWITVSELFKMWMDNITYNKVINNNYTTYSTVFNYFDNYVIPKLEIMQFSRRLEAKDISDTYGADKGMDKLEKDDINIIDIKLTNDNWGSFVGDEFSKNHYLAGYLNDLQYRRLRFLKGGVIGTIGSLFDMINNLINAIAISGDIIGNFSTKYIHEEMDDFKSQMKKASKILYNEYYISFQKIAKSYEGTSTPKGDTEMATDNADPLVEPDVEQLQYVVDYVLDKANLEKVSGSAIKKAIEGARHEGEPKLLGADTPLDEILTVMGFISTGYELYDLAKALIWIFRPPQKTNPDFTDTKVGVIPGQNKILKTKSGFGKQLANSVVSDRFLTTDFTDNGVNATLNFLKANENALRTGLTNGGGTFKQDIFKFPINFEALEALNADGRYNKSNISSNEYNVFGIFSTYHETMAYDTLYVEPVKTHIFYDVFPIGVFYNKYDYEETSTLTTFDVKFAFTHFDQK